MNKYILLVIVGLIVGVVLVLGLRNGIARNLSTVNSNVDLPQEGNSLKMVDFTASFEIYTNGTKRVFTQAMYHNQSNDVFIENPDPSLVHVKKASVTWAGFF